MTKNKIIKEKLYDIDHNLDKNMLWGELEAKLPPVKERNRRPLFWFFGGMFGLLLLGVILWSTVGHRSTVNENTLTNVIDEGLKLSASKVAIADLVVKKSSELTKTDQQTNIGELTTTPNESKSTATRNQVVTTRKATVAKSTFQNPIANNFVIDDIKPTGKNNERNQIIKQRESPIIKNTDTPSFQNENTNEKSIPKLALTLKYLDAVKGSDKQSEYSNVTVAKLPLLGQNVISESECRVQPQIADFICPALSVKSRNSNLELGVHFVYGQTKSEDTSVSLDRSINTTKGGSSTSFDIQGFDLQLRWNLYKNYGVYLGGVFLRYTDEIIFTDSQTLHSFLSVNEGYSIRSNSFSINAYNTYDLFDVNVGGFYSINIGRWNLRPSLGISHSIYNRNMQLDLVNPLQIADRDKTYSKLNQSNISYDYGLGYEIGLSMGYSFARSIGAEAGINYRSKRSITDIGQLNQSIVYKFGLNYKF